MDGKIVKSSAVGSPASATTNNAPTSIAAGTYFVSLDLSNPRAYTYSIQ